MKKTWVNFLFDGIDEYYKEEYAIYKLELKSVRPVTVRAVINLRTFSDGTPVLKHFFIDPQRSNYTFNPGKEMDLVYMVYEEKVFWYDNGIWYMLEESLDWLVLPPKRGGFLLFKSCLSGDAE